MIYVLILFAHVGAFGDGNSNSLAMYEYTSKAKCEAAGRAAAGMSEGSSKVIKFVCTEK